MGVEGESKGCLDVNAGRADSPLFLSLSRIINFALTLMSNWQLGSARIRRCTRSTLIIN